MKSLILRSDFLFIDNYDTIYFELGLFSLINKPMLICEELSESFKPTANS